MSGLLVVEGAVFGLLAMLLAPQPLRTYLLAGLALLLLYAVTYMVAPLWTHHELDAKQLRLRYGLGFRVTVPLERILRAGPARERLGMLQAIGARYDRDRRRVVAAFSDEGQVLLELDRPLILRTGWFGGGPTERILINVDRRDAFLVALAPGDVPVSLPGLEVNPISAPGTARVAGEAGTPGPGRQPGADGSPGPGLAGTTGAQPVIRTEGLTRRYGDVAAVDRLSLTMWPGEIYGFLGANGAGKTTTIKMLVGLLTPSAGQAWIAGHDVWADPLAAKAAMGYVADRSMLYERLTGREFLTFMAQLRGLPAREAAGRIDHLLGTLDLRDRADDPSGIYSFGMKRKLALAAALLHRPRVLILDEPLNGLDPRSARALKDLLTALSVEGIGIFLSIHDLATAEELCHRVGIIHRGTLVAEGTAAELRRLAAAPNLESVFLQLTRDQVEGWA